MKSEIGSSRGGLRPYPLSFHAKEAGANAKLNQHGPLGVAYHCRHPISTVPVARITAHAMVPGYMVKIRYHNDLNPNANNNIFPGHKLYEEHIKIKLQPEIYKCG
jgi:hypothetical protein